MRSRHPGRGLTANSMHPELQQSLPRLGTASAPQSSCSGPGPRQSLPLCEAGDTPAVSLGNLSPPDSMHPAMVMIAEGLFTQPPSVGIVGSAHPPRA